MKVTYLGHSGFSVELGSCILLFDYYMGEIPVWDRNKKLYVFVSHKHRDHFNMRIFELACKYERIHFFLGSDIRLSEKYLERNHIPGSVKEKITNIGKNKNIIFDEIKISSLRSTDAGVAFVISAEGRNIYHAGDLNWWHWEGESPSFNESMEKNYKREIDTIRNIRFDAVFVPLDPRLCAAYGYGMDYFLSNVTADFVFPMHMWEEYGYIAKYKKTDIGSHFQEHIVDIQVPGQEFDLWNI